MTRKTPIDTRKKMGLGYSYGYETHTQNLDLVGFIPRSILMRPRFGRFAKMDFGYGMGLRSHNQKSDPVFFGCQSMPVTEWFDQETILPFQVRKASFFFIKFLI